MRHVASVSFGKDSLCMLLRLIEIGAPLEEVVFYDTGMEFQAVYHTRGKPQRVSAAVSQLIMSPIQQHSRKPAEVRDRIVELLGGDAPKIELFARETAPGWDCWGNEIPGGGFVHDQRP